MYVLLQILRYQAEVLLYFQNIVMGQKDGHIRHFKIHYLNKE
jgi:hypothetical protein